MVDRLAGRRDPLEWAPDGVDRRDEQEKPAPSQGNRAVAPDPVAAHIAAQVLAAMQAISTL